MWSRRAAEQAASDGTNASTDGKGALPSAFGPQVDTTANWQSLNPFNTLKGLTWPQGASRILLNLFPAAVWLPRYRVRDCLRSDMVAGITVGAMLIPQGMSYALIAGLPPVYGLYAALVPIVMYAVTGSSRQLAVGPVALVSLLTATGLSEITEYEDNPALYVKLAFTVSLLVGIIQLGMGLLRLGFLVTFLSHSVISGFTSGAAILIGISQAKHLLGYDVKKSHSIQEYLESIFSNIEDLHWETLLFSILWLVLLFGSKTVAKKWKRLSLLKAMAPLIVTLLGTLIVYAGRLDKEADIKIVGEIPDGLPTPKALFSLGDTGTLIVPAIIISIIGFLESIAIAEAIAKKHDYKIDSNQELIGLGSANLVGSFFQAYPTTGGFSRTAINNEAGALTPLASIISAFIIMLTLLVLTPLFHYLPKSVLGAIVVSAVSSLVDIHEAKELFHISRFDFAVWMAAFLGVLLLGVEVGVGFAIGISLILVIYQVARPHTAVLGKIPGRAVFRDIIQYPEAELHEGILVFRMDAPLFFANAGYFSQKLDEAEEAMWCASRKAEAAGSLGGVVHYVVIEMAPVATVDATGAQALLEVAKARMQRGVRVVLANPNRGALGLLERSGVTDYIGKEWVFFRAHEAVHACREALAEVDSPTAVPIRKHGRGEGGGDEDLDGAPGGVQEPCGLLYGVTVDAIRKARLRPHGHPATSV